jgi:hypothetical protein
MRRRDEDEEEKNDKVGNPRGQCVVCGVVIDNRILDLAFSGNYPRRGVDRCRGIT